MASSATAGTVTADELVRRIGTTNDAALAYIAAPDTALAQLPARVREDLIAEVPPVTAGALLGPAALARHFVASAAAGRYRDLFGLWDVFSAHPQDCRPVLQERPEALDKARAKLRTATVLGLGGHAERVAQDTTRARGLIWQWLREVLVEHLALVGARPQVAAALLRREPDLDVHLPDEPDAAWLREAAAARGDGTLPDAIDARLRAHAHRLPATIANLDFLHEQLPATLPQVLADVDLGRDDLGAVLAWARDHDTAGPLLGRIGSQVDAAVAGDPVAGLHAWWTWREAGVSLDLPQAVLAAPVDRFDLTRPETAAVLAARAAAGEDIALDRRLDELAATNRQSAEKAFEALVCAGLPVTLPEALADNPMVRDGTRCPACQAWTWVRTGHEQRCPRLAATPPQTVR